MMSNDLSAFVVMPFKDDIDWMYDRVYRPVLEEAGFIPARADTVLDQQAIMRDVVQGIASADLIVADLTGPNPNVMYELGIAHSLKKRVMMLTQSTMDIPFDLRSYRLIIYGTSYPEVEEMKNRLLEILLAAKQGSISFGNPVTDFVDSDRLRDTTRGGGSVGFSGGSISTTSNERLGVLDIEELIPQVIEPLNNSVMLITTITQDFGRNLKARADEVSNPLKFKSMTFAQKKSFIGSVSRVFNDWSKQIDESTNGNQLDWSSLDKLLDALVALVRSDDQEDIAALVALRVILADFEESIGTAVQSIVSTQQAIAEGEYGRVSRDLGRSGSNALQSLGRLLESIEQGRSLATRFVTLIDERTGLKSP